MKEKKDKLLKRRAEAQIGGGIDRIKKQHQKKKLTARERIEYILDEGSFEEMDMFVTHRTTDFGMDKQLIFGDGVVTGYGTINNRLIPELSLIPFTTDDLQEGSNNLYYTDERVDLRVSDFIQKGNGLSWT